MIVGPVGSGKSALIKSILGEMAVKKGSIHVPFRDIVYCPQIPWIVDDTIWHNITGGTEFNAAWYNFAVSACGLSDDFQSIPAGDMHVAGSRGASLSGGQKQRVALARAVYSRLPVLLLDDIFNGLDSKHSLLPYSDRIIALDHGAVVYRGSYEDLVDQTSDAIMKNLILPQEEMTRPDTDKAPAEEIRCDTANYSSDSNQRKRDLDFSRRDGNWEVYKYYIRSAGPWISAVFVASFIVSTFLSTFSTLWIQWWSDSNAKEPNEKVGWYLGFYTAFTVVGILSFFLGCYLLLIHIISDTALTLHTDLLKATLKAPWHFFQTTDAGTMTNRFSQDMDLINMKLPLWLVNTVANVALTIMKLILLCVVGKYMAVTFPFLVTTFVLIQFIYLRTSRQVRLLDIEAKALLYAHFAETIDGINPMRAFGWQGNFQLECNRRLNLSQRPFYMLLCLQQWLNLVLDLVIAAVAVVLMAIATSVRNRFSAGGMGVALNLVLSLNQILVHAIQSWTQLETSIGAVSRVHSFKKDTPCEDADMESPPTAQEWPTEGAVDFDNLTVTYQSTDQHPILKNLTLRIKPGEKLAICGPSGSDKTSVIMTLLQMTKVKSGSVSIDGRDLASIQPSDIRSRLNVIPQDPYFVPGTIRLNIEPHAVASDAEILRAVKKVGLWKQIQMNGGLDGDLNASNWSMGERQLLALSRALTSRSPILIFDEATSKYAALFAWFLPPRLIQE
ncbi:multidrug resistance-associated protein, putative [Paecilomyces variotii No. 5]|uniref:Multidrug resistance-associated protein, putative n=1 Tax=Byssochlamys spectabilis (strain No. 5 / NBRC 109023) TaxID=1356009 RepID=V5G5K1_BYSSN|nr:multidrug resistance-associated protein, putative [Paecilomyces variotii No. 5]